MLKITGLLDKLAFNKNNGSKFISSKNNNNRLVFKKNISNNKIDGFDINKNDVKYAKKSRKMFKSRKSKS